MEYDLKKIQESIDELSSDYNDFDSFKKGMANDRPMFVYSQVGHDAIPNLCKNGTEGIKEYMRTILYGRGIYTVTSYNECKNYWQGDTMIVYAVKKNAFNNFLFFDYGMRDEIISKGLLKKKETFHEVVKRLFNPNDYADLENRFGRNLSSIEDLIDRGRSAAAEETFWNSLRGNRTTLNKNSRNSEHYDEYKLDANKVDGFAFYYGYGHTMIFRTTDLLMPYMYATRNDRDSFPPLNEFKYCFNDNENFNSANYSIDGYRRCRRNYPDTEFLDKTVAGFHIVRNKSKNRFNYLNARTHKLLSPLDFDKCDVFDPMEGTTIAEITVDGELTKFKFESVNFGENIRVFYFDDDENDWMEIEYQTFYEIMEDEKNSRIANSNNKINESVEEAFTSKSYDEFMTDTEGGKGFRVWKAMPVDVVPKVMKYGLSKEFSGNIVMNPHGDNSLYYGLVGYSVRDKDSLLGGKYGMGIVEFIVKGGIKGFLIFDPDLRNKVDHGKSVYDEIVELVPNKDDLKQIDYNLKNNPYCSSFVRNRGLDAFKTDPPGVTSQMAKAFYEACKGNNLHMKDVPALHDENILSRTRIRGYIYTGNQDGKCVAPRDFSALMPVAYSLDGGRTWHRNKEALSKDNFDFLNNDIDVNYYFRGQYPKTGIYDKQQCGYAFVTDNNNCINYMDVRTNKPLLPMDADRGTAFDPLNKTASFQLGDFAFEIDASNGTPVIYSIDDGEKEVCSYDDLMEFINLARNEYGMFKGRKIYINCMLNQGQKMPLNEGRKSIEWAFQETIPDIMLLQQNGMPIFSEEVTSEDLTEIGCDKNSINNLLLGGQEEYYGLPPALAKKNIHYDNYFSDQQAYDFILYRVKGGTVPANKYMAKLNELKKSDREIRQQVSDSKKAADGSFTNKLNRLNMIFKKRLEAVNEMNGKDAEISRMVSKLNAKYQNSRPLLYGDLMGIYMPLFKNEFDETTRTLKGGATEVKADIYKMTKHLMGKNVKIRSFKYTSELGFEDTFRYLYFPPSDM